MSDEKWTPAHQAAHDKVTQAIEEFISLDAPYDNPMPLGWAVSYEYTNASMEGESETANSIIVPHFQARATSWGLFNLGGEHFTRR